MSGTGAICVFYVDNTYMLVIGLKNEKSREFQVIYAP